MRQRALLRLLLLAGIAGAVALAVVNRDRIDPAAIDAWLSGFGIWAPLIYMALYAVATVLFLPGSLFGMAGGALFGPVWGAILNLVGATTGAGIAFLIARYIAGDWVEQKAAGRLKRLINGVEAEGWRFVAFVRLVPLFPFNLTNYAFGLTRIGFFPYVIASFICMAPGTVAYTWLGYAGREAITGDTSAIRYALLALGLLAAIAFLPRLLSRIRGTAVSWIEPEELYQQINEGKNQAVIDVRGADEFEGTLGHISGAINIPLDELDWHHDQLRALSKENVTVVCRTDKRSVATLKLLRAAGLMSVSVLRGGMERWKSTGHDTANNLRTEAGGHAGSN